ELADDRAQAVMPARSATLAEPQLAVRQGEVVDDHEHLGQWRALACEHLADREPGLVHIGLRLDEEQVEAAESASDDRGGVTIPPAAGPPGPVGQAVEDQPADVVAGLPVLLAGVAQPDD